MNSRVLPILALMIAVGIFFAYVNPTWSGSIADTKAAIAADVQALDAATAYTKQQDELTRQQSLIDPANLARLSIFLPDSADNVGLILDLNTLAARSGVSLSNIDVAANGKSSANASAPNTNTNTNMNTGAVGALPVSGASPVDSADLSLSAVGTYTAFQTFLSGIENSERLLDIKDLTVKGSDTGVYTYQMSVRFYWLH